MRTLLSNEDIPLIRTLLVVPRLSIIESFHCITFPPVVGHIDWSLLLHSHYNNSHHLAINVSVGNNVLLHQIHTYLTTVPYPTEFESLQRPHPIPIPTTTHKTTQQNIYVMYYLYPLSTNRYNISSQPQNKLCIPHSQSTTNILSECTLHRVITQTKIQIQTTQPKQQNPLAQPKTPPKTIMHKSIDRKCKQN